MSGQRRALWRGICVASLLAAQSAWPPLLWSAPLAVVKTQDLLFGKFVGGSGYSGSVTVDPQGGRSSSGGAQLLTSSCTAAGFTITGAAGSAYALSLPTAFTMSAGADQMVVTALTASIPVTGVLPAGGSLTFTVGGTLTVNGTQRNSSYRGNLDVSVK